MKLLAASLVIWVTYYVQGSWAKDLGCAERVTNYGVVCVCNSSYCDTISRPKPLSKGKYYQYITGQDSPGFSHTTGHFNKQAETDSNDNAVVFTVDSTIQYQEIVGFGGSFTDAAGIAVDGLPQKAQDKFIESYFSENGVEHSMARIPIAATDFSRSIYTYDDQEDDEDLSHFSLAEEDYFYKIPFIQQAIKVSPHDMKFVGCAFTSPGWMKTNNATSTGYVLRKHLDAWAKYHIKFLDAYAENGIKFWTISGPNEVMEPYFIGGSFVLGTLALPVNMRDWLKNHLAPQLRASNHSDVRFAPLDDMRSFAKYYMSAFAADPEASSMVNGIALHWYYDWIVPAWSLDDFHQAFPDKLIMYTESSANFILFGGDYLEPGSWHRGALYAYNMMENINHWTSVYLDWNLALNSQGGPYLQLPLDAAIIANKTAEEFYKNPMFYTIGTFSKFIPPGSRRIDVKSNLNLTEFSTQQPRLDPEKLALLLRRKSWSRRDTLVADSSVSSTTPETVLPTFPDLPTAEVPQTVSCLATTNPDSSTTVVVFNSMDVPMNVTIVDVNVGSISVTLAAQSLNTFLYWPSK